jgi:nicotinate-nucleotide adenylyltransferase
MRRKKPRRIALFGGTFDPPHVGHLIIAEQALDQLELDQVIFVPAYIPPHKSKGLSASSLHRFQMATLLAKDRSEFEVSPLELNRRGVSYTIDTLRYLKSHMLNSKLFLIIGSDNFLQFESWKSAEEILELSNLAVYPRSYGDSAVPTFPRRNVTILKGPLLEISSTAIRAHLRAHHSIRYLVPDPVRAYIAKHKLYTKSHLISS